VLSQHPQVVGSIEAIGRDALLDEGECGVKRCHGMTVDNSSRIDNWLLSTETIHHQ
jgi:hypothetical protein